MSSFLTAEVPAVSPLGVAAIVELGRCFLAPLAPEALSVPKPLDVLTLVDTRLPKFGIHICPASRQEIGDRDGATDLDGTGEITILISEEVWEELELDAPRSHYARSTVCHELGHAIIHVPALRRRLQLTNVLARTQRAKLRAYEDPEWQAWMFCGAILIPSVTLQALQSENAKLTPELVSQTYEVSSSMARQHLKRLKLLAE